MKQSRGSITERFPRCSNVPATLLHIAMLSIDSGDEGLRSAAYGLLRAVCSYLEYDKNPVVASKGSHSVFVPFLTILKLLGFYQLRSFLVILVPSLRI
jgi:hypothetical protein